MIKNFVLQKEHYVNKEISWLWFNARVLQEAGDRSVPLLERVRFLGIFSNNMDEFFRVRVATLKRLCLFGEKAVELIGADPLEVLNQVKSIVLKLQKRFDETYDRVIKDLARHKIHILDEKTLSPTQGDFVRSYFRKQVRPRLMPIMLHERTPFPELKDKFIYLMVCMHRKNKPANRKYAIIELPTDSLSRFLILPRTNSNKYVILLDDVVRYCIADIFYMFDYDRFEAYTIKVTRDAELELEGDLSESYVKQVREGLKQRKEGRPVRFIYDAQIPRPLLDFLVNKLCLRRDKEDTLIAGSRYHNHKDFLNFPDVGMKKVTYPAIQPISHKMIQQNRPLLECIAGKDIFVQFPYHSFDYFIDFLREASIDPDVRSIKMTLYRVARDSSVVNALINAIRNGKKVTVVVELQARFDEAANIYWADKLHEEGAAVIYGVRGLKVHAKLCLISRKEKGRTVNYACVGTGNFNEDTARIFSDSHLFTADKKITGEVARVFDFFDSPYRATQFKHLMVAPFSLRNKIIKMINQEIAAAKKKRRAYIYIKLNNLTDSRIIKKLYEADQAGVDVKLNVRGMFSLVPGIRGISEGIECIGIIDRFLEHTRIMMFYNGGDEKIYISSADCMTRNLDRRIEVACPIYDPGIRKI